MCSNHEVENVHQLLFQMESASKYLLQELIESEKLTVLNVISGVNECFFTQYDPRRGPSRRSGGLLCAGGEPSESWSRTVLGFKGNFRNSKDYFCLKLVFALCADVDIRTQAVWRCRSTLTWFYIFLKEKKRFCQYSKHVYPTFK